MRREDNRRRLSIRSPTALMAIVTLATPACILRAQAPASDSAAIHAVSRAFSAAYVRGDAASMAALYTADAVIFPGQSDRISGRAGITRYWTLRPGRRVTRHVVSPARIAVDGNHAYEYGVYEIAGEQDGTPWGPVKGKYVAVWRRDGADWRLQLDIWNSGPPADSSARP